MTQREKLLAGGVGGVLGLYAAYWSIKSAVYDPYQDKLVQIKSERERHDLLETDSHRKITLLQNWARQTQRTLASREHEEKAMQAFREDVQRLLSEHGFTADENLVLTPNSRPIRSKVLGEDDTALSLKIDVRGELGQMVDFLRDMYRRPYLVRVDKLTMNSESGGPNPTAAPKTSGRNRPPTPGSKRPAGKPASVPAATSAPTETPPVLAASPGGGPRLRFMVQVSTLLLPENKEVPYKALTQADLDTKLGELLPDDIDYTQIAAVNPFQIWEPVAVAKAPDPPPTTEPAKPIDKPIPTAPKRKETLIATISLNGEPIAYVRNDDRKQDPPRELKLNDELDNGKIVFIHQYGLVVRVKGAGAAPAKDYFYPIGELLTNRKELTDIKDNEYPGVLGEFARARGA